MNQPKAVPGIAVIHRENGEPSIAELLNLLVAETASADHRANMLLELEPVVGWRWLGAGVALDELVERM